MDIRPIRNNDNHRLALREVERLWGAEEGTPEGDKLEVLTILIEAYEDRYYPVPDARSTSSALQSRIWAIRKRNWPKFSALSRERLKC
jgi:HTH-type transcriptional regulator / antitoxin HigA